MALLTADELAEKLNLSTGQFMKLQRSSPTFPAAIRLTERTLRWDSDEVENWIESKKEVKNGDGS